ncbi:hypothetical protein N5D83_02730 [Pseudomonas chengduensis]|nr:DUF6682 family protein [Pseudomonas chengduensis]MDH1865733.1 hypothetical protein [Pseudomonas chengduensis]
MKLAELIRRVRTEANDMVVPYFWSDEDVAAWLNDAVSEACIRARLIHESQDAAVCQIAVTAGQAVYPLHPALYELTRLALYPADGSRPEVLRLCSSERLDAERLDWPDEVGCPLFAVQGDTDLRLVPSPEQGATLKLEGYRTPIVEMKLADKDSAEPAIHREHHRHLIHWALHKGFAVPDMETFDPNRSAQAERAFEDHFGLRPSADLRRSTREDTPHHNEAFWP